MLIESMFRTMHEEKGIGLAAPQVGVNIRLFVVDIGDGPVVLINPKILRKKGSVVMEEGCLSIPGVMVDVKRPEEITVRYTDQENKQQQKTCSELLARVIQHENDHLNGKLIVDYAGLAAKIKLKKQLQELRKLSKAEI